MICKSCCMHVACAYLNKLPHSTFTPQVARMVPPRPVTADDLERDRVLSQRIALFRWIEPRHLDIPEEHGSEGFMMFAQQGLSLPIFMSSRELIHSRITQDQSLQSP